MTIARLIQSNNTVIHNHFNSRISACLVSDTLNAITGTQAQI